MSTGIILNIITASLMLAALIFLNRATRKPIVPDAAGRYHLRMNKLYSLAGILGVLMGLGLALMAILRGSTVDTGEIAILAVILGVFWGTGIPCLLYYYNHRVTFDDASVTVTTALGKTTTTPWQDITSAQLRSLPGVIIINTAVGKIKIHQHLVGLSNLAHKLTEKKGWDWRSPQAGSTPIL